MIRKTLLVTSLALLVGTVGLWVRSYWVADLVVWNEPRRHCSLEFDRGRFVVGAVWSRARSPLPPSSRFPAAGVHYHRTEGRGRFDWSPPIWFQWQKRARLRMASFVIATPLWIPSVGLALTTIVLARPLLRTWHRRRHNLCVTCGYDLRGNTSRVCSECGQPVATDQNARTERRGLV